VACLAYIEGRVPIDGKQVLVRILAASNPQSIDPRNASIEMDVNGDGRIDPTGNGESQDAKGEDAIFRIGERYVSVRSVDLATGRMVLESRPASAYQGVDLTPGSVVPDFSFVDLEGKPHKLSDWRGRYVLLDFWATWCAPCIAEFPNLKKAHTQYHPRGFEIVGVLYHDDDDKARKFLAQSDHQLPWLHATAQSTQEVVDKRLRIQSVPATVLLDPQGRVVSAGGLKQPPLRGEKLAETLAKLFPGKDAGKPGRP
jgi:thiol-disulfide isomerase/thioredoxin